MRRSTPEQRAKHAADELKRYRRRRQEAIHRMGGKCVRCSSTEQLELDHVDPDRKTFDISANWSIKPATWADEAAKCQLLCRTCHQRKTVEQRAARIPHGRRRYRSQGCRCAVCNADYSLCLREKRQRRKEREAKAGEQAA